MGCLPLDEIFAEAFANICECYNIDIVICEDVPKKSWWKFWKGIKW